MSRGETEIIEVHADTKLDDKKGMEDFTDACAKKVERMWKIEDRMKAAHEKLEKMREQWKAAKDKVEASRGPEPGTAYEVKYTLEDVLAS